jgi:hypothetical protein
MRQAVVLGFAALLLSSTAPALAHHSLSMFEREKTVTVTGIVKEFAWGTPHIFIEVESDGADGMVVHWNIEGSSPRVLARSGWRPSVVKPGDKISLGVHPRKDGTYGGYLADEEPLLVNGRTLIGALLRLDESPAAP